MVCCALNSQRSYRPNCIYSLDCMYIGIIQLKKKCSYKARYYAQYTENSSQLPFSYESNVN